MCETLKEKRSCKYLPPSWILSCGQQVSSSFQVSSFKKWAMETTSVAVDEIRFHISQCPRSCRRRDIIYKTIEHFWIKVYWHITEILTRRFSERSDNDSNSHCFLMLYIYKCRPLQSINVFSVFFRSFFSFVAPILARFLRFYLLRWHILDWRMFVCQKASPNGTIHRPLQTEKAKMWEKPRQNAPLSKQDKRSARNEARQK